MPKRTDAFDELDGKDLRLLVGLRRHGSISKAAEECGFGQPAATKRLQRIRGKLGFTIIQAENGATKLTEEGELLAKHASRVLRSLSSLQAELGGKSN